MFSTLYDFCRDQGSIIGGLLALAAGYLVFRGTTRTADRQVAAANAQTEALRQQNRDLRNEGQRRQGRDGIVATKLLASVLGKSPSLSTSSVESVDTGPHIDRVSTAKRTRSGPVRDRGQSPAWSSWRRDLVAPRRRRPHAGQGECPQRPRESRERFGLETFHINFLQKQTRRNVRSDGPR